MICPRSLLDVAHLLPLMQMMCVSIENDVAAARAAGIFRPWVKPRPSLFDRVCQQLFPIFYWLHKKKKERDVRRFMGLIS